MIERWNGRVGRGDAVDRLGDIAPVCLEQIGERMAGRPINVEEGRRGTMDEARESDAD